MGYRYYDTSRVRVQYPFGFGLSYTSFEYENLEVSKDGVRFQLKNTGNRDGAEVAQLYVGCWDGTVFRPEKELKGFKKVFLKAGETKKVEIPFDDKTFRYWNSRTNRWEVEGGTYQVLVGACVMDIRLSGSIALEGTTKSCPAREKICLPTGPALYRMCQRKNTKPFWDIRYLPGNGRASWDLMMRSARCIMQKVHLPDGCINF